MGGNVASREQCQLALAPLRGSAGYNIWRLAKPGVVEVRPWHVVSPVLALAMLISAALAHWWPGSMVITIALLPVCLAVRILNARRVAAVIDAFRLIGPLIAAAAILQRVVDEDSSDLTGGLVADVPALRRLRIVTGWIARDSVTMDPLSGVLFELLNFFLALDGNALLFGGIELRRRAAALQRTLAAVGEVDAAMALASYRAGTDGWTRPSFHEIGSAVSIRGLRHPLLPGGVPTRAAAVRHLEERRNGYGGRHGRGPQTPPDEGLTRRSSVSQTSPPSGRQRRRSFRRASGTLRAGRE
jgi:hypothetical protein